MDDPSGPEYEGKALIEVHLDRADAPERVTIRTNLRHVPAPVQNELQTILDCARLALEAVDAATQASGRFADAHLHMDPAENRRLPLPELKQETRRRLIRGAVQDAVELVHQPLEQARRVLALWDMHVRHGKGETVRLDFEDDAATFHKRSLDQKFDILQRKYGFIVDHDAVEIVRGLYRARNCIVHRMGHVTPIDADGTGVLRASWEEYAIWASKDPGDFSTARRVPFGEIVQAGEGIQLRRMTKVREFAVGTTLELSGQDVAEICHTIHLFASQVRDDLRKRSLALGIPIDGELNEPRLGRNH